MEYFIQTDLSLYTAVILLLLLFGQAPSYDRSLLSHRLFRGMVFLTLVILLLDTIGWSLEGIVVPELIVLNWITSTLGCLLSPFTALFWYLYAHSHILGDNPRTLKNATIIGIPAVLYAGFAIFAPLHGLLFRIDENNRFSRGPMFNLMAALMIGYLLTAFILLILLRRKINHRDILPLFSFMIPPFVFGILQYLFYGITLVWSGMTLSLLVLHLYLQHHSLRTDYLTGLFNRRQLDRYLSSRIDSWNPERVLGAMLLDVDNFKAINDSCGHAMGDRALEELANLLRKSFHSSDFISRYAGDEFVVVLDTAQNIDFLALRARIQDNLMRLNGAGSRPYQLEVSIGCALFDPVRHKTVDQYLHHIDMRMYHEKNMKKALRTAPDVPNTVEQTADSLH